MASKTDIPPAGNVWSGISLETKLLFRMSTALRAAKTCNTLHHEQSHSQSLRKIPKPIQLGDFGIRKGQKWFQFWALSCIPVLILSCAERGLLSASREDYSYWQQIEQWRRRLKVWRLKNGNSSAFVVLLEQADIQIGQYNNKQKLELLVAFLPAEQRPQK